MEKHKPTPPGPACSSTPLYFTNSLPQNPESSLVRIPGHHPWFVPTHPVFPPCPPPPQGHNRPVNNFWPPPPSMVCVLYLPGSR